MPKSAWNKEATAETIENNTRKLIIDERPINLKYYDQMSELLDALIEQRRERALDYREYLQKLETLVNQAVSPDGEKSYPAQIGTSAQRAFYDNFGEDAELAVELDAAIRGALKEGWPGNLELGCRGRRGLDHLPRLGSTDDE
jgi:type I restriction enzyme R subunit